MIDRELVRRAEAALDEVGALHLARRPVLEMSSGEGKRILIARALVHRPKTLIFDEPSNSLDLAAQQELRDAMSRLAQAGVGLLLVTHYVADIVPEIERAVLLSGGTILADGPKYELLTRERLGQLFGIQVEVRQRNGYYECWSSH
jgi:iron complex transport system ATP-binding protein